MPRKTLSIWIVLLGLALGLLGNVFFYQNHIGLSFPLFIIILVVVLLAASRPAQTPVNWRNLWPLLPLVFFAVMVAVRVDVSVMTLNIAATLTLGALALHYLPKERPLDEGTLEEHALGVIEASIVSFFAALPEVGQSFGALREKSWQGRTLVAVLRGLALAAPIILVFTLLLGSADAVFAEYVENAWEMLAFNPDASLIDQAMITLGLGWLSIGTLAYGIARRELPGRRQATTPDTEEADDTDAEAFFAYGDDEPVAMAAVERTPVKRKRGTLRIGLIETGIVLGLVDVLFGMFVLVQFAYFFGGVDTIANTGISYAQYARRGFFELVAVSVLTLGLVLWLNMVTVRQEGRQNRIFIGLATILVALTSVMLISASQRMFLYEEAFGFTHLRVFTHVFMLWLGILFGVFLLSLFGVKKHVFALGVVLVTIGYLGTLNLMNVDLYIAQRNIDRFYDGHALDLRFLGLLSADAVPAVIELYQSDNPDAREWSAQWLARQLDNLDQRRAQSNSLFSFNLTRSTAWATLDALRAELPEYDPAYFWSSSSGYDIYADREPSF